jgi:hypothetical protein
MNYYQDEKSGWIYETNNDPFSFKITPKQNCKKTPDKLFKFYSLNKNNLDALISRNIFASHPFQLNDLIDCNHDLVDFTKVTIIDFYNFYSVFGLTKKEISKKYDDDKNHCFNKFRSNIHNSNFSQLGVISLSEDNTNLQMWTLYTKNEGFALEFNTFELKKPDNYFGPFPINYVEKLSKIPYKYGLTSILYQTNIKNNNWSNENEWRFLGYKPNMDTFNINGDIFEKGEENRLFKYSEDALNSVCLGFQFFKGIYSNSGELIDLSKLRFKKTEDFIKKELLNYLSIDFKKSIFILGIDTNTLKFGPIPISINKICNSKFKIEYLKN